MNTEEKIKSIESAIDMAERRTSKVTQRSMDVPALASLNIRHLLNNLGAISERYLEVGVHKGGSFCSTICRNNLLSATGIDSFESDRTNPSDMAEPQFLNNAAALLQAGTEFKLLKGDSFKINLDEIIAPIDFYLYDAGHSKEDQRDALIYYKPALADEFIYCCDDFNWGDVEEGTFEGIREGDYEILYYRNMSNPEGTQDAHLNEFWWRGYGIFLLRKK